MKKIARTALSLILAALIFVSAATLAVGAAEHAYTHGPSDKYVWMTGGAVLDFCNKSNNYRYVLRREGDENEGSFVIDNETVPGAEYDLASNTLTITDLKLPNDRLEIYYMGDDFKLEVKGECELGDISVRNYFGMHSTSLNITGMGTLTVNENKNSQRAIYFYGEGDNNFMHFDIADSVTVHLYGQDLDDPGMPVSVAAIYSTYVTPDDGGAITVGGKTMEEATAERNSANLPEYISALKINNTDTVYKHGYRVTSKTDPEGHYAVQTGERNTDNGTETFYNVSKYTYYPELDMYLTDPNFSGSDYSDYRNLSEEEFNAEYEYALEPQEKRIRYTSDRREAERGYTGYQLTKADDPDGIYIATTSRWHTYSLYEDAQTYYIYRVVWSEDEDYYVVDSSFNYETVAVDELEDKGYSYATEKVEQNAKMLCWIQGAPYDDSNRQQSFSLMTRASDPNGLYVFIARYTDRPWRDESGFTVSPVIYDEENDEYYVNYYGGTVGTDIFKVTDDEWDNGESEFSDKMEVVDERLTLLYTPANYSYNYYSTESVLVEKDGEYYSYGQYTEDGQVKYFLFHVELRDNGRYYSYGNDVMHFTDMSELSDAGYEIVIEPQPVEYTTTGAVNISRNYTMYLDSEGNRYFDDWNNHIYSVSEDNKVKYGANEFYIGTLCEGLYKEDLISTVHTVYYDDYGYFIEGTEYHHIGSDTPAVLMGDVNGDEKVNNRDAVILDRYVAGWEGYEDNIVSMTAADLSGDGKVNNRDAVILDRYIAGWDGYDKYIVTK